MPRSWKKETQIKNHDSVYRVLYEHKNNQILEIILENFFVESGLTSLLFWICSSGSIARVAQRKSSALLRRRSQVRSLSRAPFLDH
jgi:hypothetical protein